MEQPNLGASARRGSTRAAPRGWARAQRTLVLALIAAAFCLWAPAAYAAPGTKFDANLSALWAKVLVTPSAQNPFGSGGSAFACLALDKAVAPFGPGGVASCTVTTGTRIFVAASSSECSTFEGNGTTEADLRACARRSDAQVAPSLTLDGKTVTADVAESKLLKLTLPADNIFGQPAGTTGLSVAHGWVALLHPMTPGTHTIIIGTGSAAIVTKIIVQPGR